MSKINNNDENKINLMKTDKQSSHTDYQTP